MTAAMTRIGLLRAAADVVDSMTKMETAPGRRVQTGSGKATADVLRKLSLEESTPPGPFGGGAARLEIGDSYSALLRYLVHLRDCNIHHVKVLIGDDGRVTWEERADAMLAEFKPHVDFAGSRVLSVGCNTGGDLSAILDAGAMHVTGLDMIPELVSFCSLLLSLSNVDPARWTTRCGDFETFECAEQFDVIYHAGVLYHVENPMRSLRRAFSLLSPGGTLALETEVIKDDRHDVHDYRSILFWPLMEPQYIERGINWPTWFIPSEFVVAKMLECAGFENVVRAKAKIAKAAFIARKPL